MNQVAMDPKANSALKFISKILMEEGIEGPTYILQGSALQDAEKPFYDLISQRYCCSSNTNNNPSDPNYYQINPNQNQLFSASTNIVSAGCNNSFITADHRNMVASDHLTYYLSENNEIETSNRPLHPSLNNTFQFNLDSISSPLISSYPAAITEGLQNQEILDIAYDIDRAFPVRIVPTAEEGKRKSRKIYCRKQGNEPEMKRNNDRLVQQKRQRKGSAQRKNSKKSQVDNKEQVIDIPSLLIHCAEAVASDDHRNSAELLQQIKQHSYPSGDATQRVAHYMAIALEARVAVNQSREAFACLSPNRVPSDAQILKACNRILVSACPFMNLSHFYSIQTILDISKKADRLHIIHFGIPYSFPWLSLIQDLSTRPGGPPALRVTAIAHAQPVFRQAACLEETGRCLETYCEEFHVPFEYDWISGRWERLEDLKINRNDTVVVISLYQFRHLLDETVVLNSQRDAVLNLIKTINPEVFIHGIINGAHDSPFFVSRFREAFFYYSTMFDMIEANASWEDASDRLLFEKEVFGKEITNVIACEGLERIERPETYKQWQVRNQRAGLRQVPLKKEIMRKAKELEPLKLCCNKHFLVDQDGPWMLQGWKGRILFAISSWKSASPC